MDSQGRKARLTLEVSSSNSLDLAVIRLPPSSSIPSWALDSAFFSITKTQDELSIVCLESKIPQGSDFKIERGWRSFVTSMATE